MTHCIEIVKEIGKIISTKYYSTEFSKDIVGVEVCAAIKNIYSMLIGASVGLSSDNADDNIKSKYYLNTAASLVHKSMSEMRKMWGPRFSGKKLIMLLVSQKNS